MWGTPASPWHEEESPLELPFVYPFAGLFLYFREPDGHENKFPASNTKRFGILRIPLRNMPEISSETKISPSELGKYRRRGYTIPNAWVSNTPPPLRVPNAAAWIPHVRFYYHTKRSSCRNLLGFCNSSFVFPKRSLVFFPVNHRGF